MVLIRSRTLHIYSFYLASARIFNWQYTILLSLFQLFRGKKHNVLRKRIDSCDYDLDQLLLGTILFTLLFFLLPTVVVFYLTFACSRMAIISLKAALDTLLACLNHFPLFALMLRIKDSQRLPGILLVLLSRFLTNEHKVAFVLNFDIPNNFLVFPLIPPLYRQPRTYFSK
jgi:phosphatidylinositol glycan class Q protein